MSESPAGRESPPQVESRADGESAARPADLPERDWLSAAAGAVWDPIARTLGPPLGPVWNAIARHVGPLLLPGIPGIALIVAAWLGSSWLARHQQRAVRTTAEAQALLVGRELDLAIERRIRKLEGLALETARRHASVEDWTLEVQPLAFQDLQFRAIVWLDAKLSVRAVAPPTERLFPTLYPEDDDLRRVALQGVILDPSHDPSRGFVTASLPMPSGEYVLLFAAPLSDSISSELILAPVRTRDLIDAVASASIKKGWSVTVMEGPIPMFGPRWQDGGPTAADAGMTSVAADGLAWSILVWPDERLASRLDSPAPDLVMWLGFAVAILTSLMILLLRPPAATPPLPGEPPARPVES